VLRIVPDTDPTFHSDANPDPSFQFDADPDPTTNFSPDLDPPMLQNGPLRLPPFHFDADANADPDPAFHFDADAEPDLPKGRGSMQIRIIHNTGVR
jgi:hypothetical protein